MFFVNRFVGKTFFLLLLLVYSPLIFTSASLAGVTIDGTLKGVSITLDGPNFQIISDYGIIKNTNLFHSFGEFNINSSQSATFSGPQEIRNVIGRITNGAVSNIDGLITFASENMPMANLYLINPSGFMFGPNATLSIPGSFHVTTADYLALGDEGIFYADPAQPDNLTVDPPSAFGFLSSSPGNITIKEAVLEVTEGKTVSIIGGDIDFKGLNRSEQSEIHASSGRIDIASVLSEGEVIPNYSTENPGLSVGSIDTLGSITMELGYVDAGGDGGGTVFIRGGELRVDRSYIYASTKENSGAESGAGIDINVTGDMILDNPDWGGCVIGTNIFEGVEEDSGGVRISADHLEIKNGSSIRSVAFLTSAGRTGDIVLDTNSLLIENSATVQSGTGGSTDSGDIIINTGTLEIHDNGFLWTNAFGGSGDSGNIKVTADNIFLSNEKYPGYPTGITTRTYGSANGNAGNITLNTKNMQLLSSTEISSPTWSLGNTGNISITIEEKGSITGKTGILTGIFTNTFYSGKGGDISLVSNQFDLNTNASIQANALSVGDAGNISLDVDTLEIYNGSYITARGQFGYGGDAGDVSIAAEDIIISGLENSDSPFLRDLTGISTASGRYGGSGGDIRIETSTLEMTNRSLITATSTGPGEGGEININAMGEEGIVSVLNGSAITASAFGTGKGGLVAVDADHIKISGVHPDLYFDGYIKEETLSPSAIASQAGLNGGIGGNLDLKASTIEILDGGLLATDTYGSGKAGDIHIQSDHLIVSGVNTDMRQFIINTGGDPKQAASDITTSTSSHFLGDLATGDGGEIYIKTGMLTLSEGGHISSETSTPGNGGNIRIEAINAGLYSESSINAGSWVSESAGKAGNIKISVNETLNIDNASLLTASQMAPGGDIIAQANDISMTNQASISAHSEGSGDAGNIYLGGNQTFKMDNSVVSTEAQEADGGNIKIFANHLVYLVDSLVSASVGGGGDTSGGNIDIDPEFVVLKNSQIIANAHEGKGGNINIVADVFLADPDSVIDASSQLGIDGQVAIQAPVTHVSSLVTPLSKDFRSVVALLRQPCMARMQKGKYSSLMIKGRTSLPVEPGRFLSSPISSH